MRCISRACHDHSFENLGFITELKGCLRRSNKLSSWCFSVNSFSLFSFKHKKICTWKSKVHLLFRQWQVEVMPSITGWWVNKRYRNQWQFWCQQDPRLYGSHNLWFCLSTWAHYPSIFSLLQIQNFLEGASSLAWFGVDIGRTLCKVVFFEPLRGDASRTAECKLSRMVSIKDESHGPRSMSLLGDCHGGSRAKTLITCSST